MQDLSTDGQIIEAKKKLCAPAMLITLTKITFTRTFNKVKLQNTLSGTFRTECGIRQGDFVSTLMFNIGLEKVTRKIEINQVAQLSTEVGNR
jgi:hypothetical protein